MERSMGTFSPTPCPSGSTSIPPEPDLPNGNSLALVPKTDGSTHTRNPEIDILIAKYLLSGPYKEAGKTLVQQMELNQAIPPSINWKGKTVTQDFNSFDSKISHHIGPDYLSKLVTKLVNQPKNEGPNLSISNEPEAEAGPCRSTNSSALPVPSTQRQSTSLLSLSSTSRIYERIGSLNRRGLGLVTHPTCHRVPPNTCANFVHSLRLRELFGTSLNYHPIHPDFLGSRFMIAKRTLGHLGSVYCAIFDRTGKYIITGADDNLIKIWSTKDGRLVSTLRGNSAEITDLAINMENNLLASGSMDRLVRIWSLSTGELVKTLAGHARSVTTVSFCPMSRKVSPTVRFVVSTGRDGIVCFWAYKEQLDGSIIFEPKPTEFQERMRPGSCQMQCSSFSPGGVFYAAGNADYNVRVYYMLDPGGPIRILEKQAHTDSVDCIAWANSGVRFASGDRDGIALIWKLDPKCGWRNVKIDVKFPEENRQIHRIRMVAWSCDDRLVFTAYQSKPKSTQIVGIKVWDSENGVLIRSLKAHTDNVFVVEPHPFYPRVLCTAGHDGKLIIWDVGNHLDGDLDDGKIIFQYKDVYNDNGAVLSAFLDGKWSADGTKFVGTDDHGHLLIFTVSRSPEYDAVPEQLFFHTDYRSLQLDGLTGQVLDEQTHIRPHLMPPPFLVNLDGAPYPTSLQRLVPGRENCRDEQLVPNPSVLPDGVSVHNNAILGQIYHLLDRDSNIVQRIILTIPGARLPSSRHPPERFRHFYSDVRRTHGNWQTATSQVNMNQRNVVLPLPQAVIQAIDDTNLEHGQLEDYIFQTYLLGSRGSSRTSIPPDLQIQVEEAERFYYTRCLQQQTATAAQERRIAEETNQSNSTPPQILHEWPNWYRLARRQFQYGNYLPSGRRRRLRMNNLFEPEHSDGDDPLNDPNFPPPPSESASESNSESLVEDEDDDGARRRRSLRPRNRNSNALDPDHYYEPESPAPATRRLTRSQGAGRTLNSPPISQPDHGHENRERSGTSGRVRVTLSEDEEYIPRASVTRRMLRSAGSSANQRSRRPPSGRTNRAATTAPRNHPLTQSDLRVVINDIGIGPFGSSTTSLGLTRALRLQSQSPQSQSGGPTPSPPIRPSGRQSRRANVIHSDPEVEIDVGIETPPPSLRAARTESESSINFIHNVDTNEATPTPPPPTLQNELAQTQSDEDQEENSNDPHAIGSDFEAGSLYEQIDESSVSASLSSEITGDSDLSSDVGGYSLRKRSQRPSKPQHQNPYELRGRPAEPTPSPESEDSITFSTYARPRRAKRPSCSETNNTSLSYKRRRN